jgi:hypothetical protein
MTLKPQQTQSQLSISATAVFDIDASADGSTPAALPKFRMVAYTGGPMRVSGWRYPVIIDLAGMSIPSQSRPIRFGHDPLSGVGHTDAIRVESGQLIATGVVSRDTPAAREVVVSSKNGFPWQASVGAGVDEFEFVKEGQKVTVNGTQYSGPVNVVRKSSLGEISLVPTEQPARVSQLRHLQTLENQTWTIRKPQFKTMPIQLQPLPLFLTRQPQNP